MHTIQATCPRCQQTHPYGAELIGRYTLCLGCGCRFYIEVPPLSAAEQPAIAEAPVQVRSSASTTLDDLLWDTQQGSRLLWQSLRRQEKQLQILLWLVCAFGALTIATLGLTVGLWLR
jgi:hypothetical protein